MILDSLSKINKQRKYYSLNVDYGDNLDKDTRNQKRITKLRILLVREINFTPTHPIHSDYCCKMLLG